jgi:hypothetical protein
MQYLTHVVFITATSKYFLLKWEKEGQGDWGGLLDMCVALPNNYTHIVAHRTVKMRVKCDILNLKQFFNPSGTLEFQFQLLSKREGF